MNPIAPPFLNSRKRAKIMQAAPDLAQALIYFLECGHKIYHPDDVDSPENKARAALKKAGIDYE